MITRRQLLGPMAIIAAAAITSCTREPASEEATVELPTPSSGSVTPSPGGDEDSEELEPTFSAAPTDADSETAAAGHAIATLEAFWDTRKTQEQWFTDLAALMTPSGGEPFEYTLVENVVPTEATGDPTVIFLDEGNTAEVTVPSGQGTWTLTLYRDSTGWLTESIRFPEGD